METNDKILKPEHVGIIMDGNRRWAKEHKLPSLEGHRQGLNNLKKIIKTVFQTGVKILTVYAFSKENWQREAPEVEYLMKLFKFFIKQEIKSLVKQGVKVNFWGCLSDFSADLQEDIKKLQELTKFGRQGTLNICMSYGGRDELVRAFRRIISQKVRSENIDEDLISRNLDSAGYPDPDLIIRTSGEQRLSGFMTWQSVYSELYFIKKYWPDFSLEDLKEALSVYTLRQRRFGSN